MFRLRIIFYFLLIAFVVYPATNSNVLRFNLYTADDGLSQNTVLTIAKDKFGFMWFGTWEGVSRFDGYTFQSFRADEDNQKALSNNRINAIVTDEDKNIWISTADENFVFLFNYDLETFTRFALSNVPKDVLEKINNYSHTRKRVYTDRFNWTATDDGLIQTDKQNHSKRFVYQTDPGSPFALSDHQINVVYLDDDENLWVGTQNGGVNIANLTNKNFDYYSVGTVGLTDNVIRAICQDKSGKLWIGTNADGITVMDPNDNDRVYTRYGEKELINPNIRNLYCDTYGFVWIGTKGGLDRFNQKTGCFRHYYAKVPGSIQNNSVFWIMEDHSGCLWVGTFDGIAKYDRINDKFINYYPKGLLNNGQVRVIIEDSENRLWIGTEGGGITRLDRKSVTGSEEKFIPHHYLHNDNDTNSLINDLVLTMIEDEDEKIWIGTNSGLCRLDPKSDRFERFSVSTGFPDDLIMGLLSDGKGNIWISHKKGITCMNIRTFEFRTFSRYDGLQGNEFTQNAFYRNPDTGEMFFGGTNGLNAFMPDDIAIIPKKPQPILTGLKIMNQAVRPGMKVDDRQILEKSLFATKKITLSWQDMNFSIHFSSLSYNNPYGCKFKYKMEGLDREWIYTDASLREAIYTHLPAGEYTFNLFASNSDGIWSEKPVTLDIEILPPWWLSLWAKGIYWFLFLVVAWFVYRYIKSRIDFQNRLLVERFKNERNEELMNMKLQFFTELSHEFRTPLTLIIDPLEQLLSGKPDKEQVRFYYQMMNRNAKQLLELINQLLDFRKLQSKNLAVFIERLDFIFFVKNVAAAFEQKARDLHIRYVVLASDETLLVDFDQDKMRKIVNNLLSNAFRFTPAYGEIIVRIYKESDISEFVILEVQDNGSGISPEFHDKIFEVFYQVAATPTKTAGSGLGLALTRELVLLHHAEISLISDLDKGACFKVRLPLRQTNSVVFLENVEVTKPLIVNKEIEINVSFKSEAQNQPLLLVIDDNDDIRNYICMNFANTYRIVSANDGLSGFNKAAETIPDLIISDIMMPGIDGIELCKRLKTDERTSHIPVILLTARRSDESIIEGYDTGADAYVTKPFSIEVLGARIANLLEQRMKLRALFSDGSKADLKKIAINITDESFLNKVVKLIEDNMEETAFDGDKLAELLKMSRSQLYRKIKSLTNRTVHDFIISIRMNKSLEYLLDGELSISETAYKVGFSIPSNFTRTFTKHFGLSPTKYIERHKK